MSQWCNRPAFGNGGTACVVWACDTIATCPGVPPRSEADTTQGGERFTMDPGDAVYDSVPATDFIVTVPEPVIGTTQQARRTPLGSGGLSVVVPTRHEAANISPLVERIENAAGGDLVEIIFVDDSDDDLTVLAINDMATRAICDIRVIYRPPGEREGGLGGAVVEGLRLARGAWSCVMDADLQHPPEVIPRLLTAALQENVDLAIASRYCGTGEAGGLNAVRAMISQGFTSTAQLMFRQPLRGVTDPMSGYFLVKNSAINLDSLRPRGFKILLEILVRTPHLRRTEVDYRFAERNAEESKASLREGFRFLTHIMELRFGQHGLQMAKFLSVGATGIVVNIIALLMLTELLGFFYLVSVVLATQVSSLWNFGLTESWVFASRRRAAGLGSRMLKFLGINNLALVARGPLIVVMTSLLSIHYALSVLVSLIALALVRYVISDSWIWRKDADLATQQQSYDYNIHDIITIRSDVGLPELASFLTAEPLDRPMMTVRICKKSVIRRRAKEASADARKLVYDEGFGPLGFAINVTAGETIDILASPVLRRSPHVLYTNVVEPILRWTFVKHGYALVHGACISFGQDAYLVTARTDTGKTTTILRILDAQQRASDNAAFLSDDLTLISPGGAVLTYPKPMTISNHTVAAVHQPLLSRRERLTLPLQARLHSRGGRRFALLLAKSRMPMATVNAIVQWIVPPPKYHVQRLVPGAKLRERAHLAGLFVIERGGEGEVLLDYAESLETLMSNSEDAYGFPPYESIKGFLHQAGGVDLRELERQIVATALEGLPAQLFRSTTMDWAARIPLAIAPRPRVIPEVPSVAEVWGLPLAPLPPDAATLKGVVAAGEDFYAASGNG